MACSRSVGIMRGYQYPGLEELVEGVLYQFHPKLREETDVSNMENS